MRRMVRGSFRILSGLVLWTWLAAGLAMDGARADAAAEPAEYRAITHEAIAEYDAGNYLEARALFAKAVAMMPNARAYRGLGMTEFELRNYGDSVTALERALASEVKPLEGGLRQETERLLERARTFVAQVNVALEPSGATVTVDDIPVPLQPRGNLVLTVGEHVIEFRAEGRSPQTRRFLAKGGERESWRIVLPEERGAAPSLIVTNSDRAAPHDDRSSRRPLYKNAWLWTGVGVAAAALAVGLGVGLRSKDSGSNAPDLREAGTLMGP